MASWTPDGAVWEDRSEDGARHESGFWSASNLHRRLQMPDAASARVALGQAVEAAENSGWKPSDDSRRFLKVVGGAVRADMWVALADTDESVLILSLTGS